MCVIALINNEESRPSETMIDMMWDRNKDGAGLAWREQQSDNTNLVCWEKGLMGAAGLERVKKLAAELPTPYIMHFRIATIGGVKPLMTHPFIVDERGINTLKGKTPGYVLFHNGTYRSWETDVKALALNTGTRLPAGKWSDSRAIAWIMSVIGNGYMELLSDQRGLAFGPTGSDIFVGSDGWKEVEDPETKVKIWCSNDHFFTTGRSTGNLGYVSGVQYCSGPRSCLEKAPNLDKDGRCKNHPIVKALPPAETGKGSVVPFPQTPKDADNPEGPILTIAAAEKAFSMGRIQRNFVNSVKKAHERMKGKGKDADRARRALIIAGKLPPFHGIL